MSLTPLHRCRDGFSDGLLALRVGDPPLLILASASPRRRELLAELGVAFEVAPVDVDETLPPGAEPRDAAVELARRKARVAALRSPGRPVLAADTLVVAADGEVLGKPTDAADAERMLRLHSDATQQVITGVCLRKPPPSDGADSVEVVGAEVTRVTMRPLSEDEIAAYVLSGEPFGKAGGYAIQESADRFVTRVEGSWSNVVGLPLELLARLLRDAGLEGLLR